MVLCGEKKNINKRIRERGRESVSEMAKDRQTETEIVTGNEREVLGQKR